MLSNDQHQSLTPESIAIEDFDYVLPDERIARFPLAERDASKLLIYKNGQISETIFKTLDEQVPSGAVLVFNDTKVIHARFKFQLDNGKPLEIFCLEPLFPADYAQNLGTQGAVSWKCMIGGNRHWKSGHLDQQIEWGEGQKVSLHLERGGYEDGTFKVNFAWLPAHYSFGELMAGAGIIPLPPYLKRDSEPEDASRYQTVYAREQGSVAAPTAGLHFTELVLERLRKKGISTLFVTLHVGAGTFKPVQSASLAGHQMHEEIMSVSAHVIQQVLQAKLEGKPVIAVGTTSMRSLESLYWHSNRLMAAPGEAPELLSVRQWDPYKPEQAAFSPIEALQNLSHQLSQSGSPIVQGATQLLVAPGYTSRLVDGLITNFHQPRSTLLLLIASMVGQDWRRIYQHALDHDFRFLSYGDSSLLWPLK